MTRSTANGAARPATDMVAHTVRIGCTGMGRAATSASGAARRPMARVVRTPRRAAMRSNDDGGLDGRREEVIEELHLALGELESGNALADFVEGHGLQSWYFVFS